MAIAPNSNPHVLHAVLPTLPSLGFFEEFLFPGLLIVRFSPTIENILNSDTELLTRLGHDQPEMGPKYPILGVRWGGHALVRRYTRPTRLRRSSHSRPI
jgi:hypothetical protein